jgi:hypothetical protein
MQVQDDITSTSLIGPLRESSLLGEPPPQTPEDRAAEVVDESADDGAAGSLALEPSEKMLLKHKGAELLLVLSDAAVYSMSRAAADAAADAASASLSSPRDSSASASRSSRTSRTSVTGSAAAAADAVPSAPPARGLSSRLLGLVGVGAAVKPPRERHGFQQWKAHGGLVSRLDLQFVEAVNVLRGPPATLRLAVPRSAIPSGHPALAAGGDAAPTGSAKPTRAVLSFALGAEGECRLWQLAVRHAHAERWQATLEGSCIPPPEVYRLHARSKELRRRGAPQSRLLVLSDARVYSVRRDGVSMRSADWSSGVEAIEAIEENVTSDKRVASAYPYSLTLQWRSGAGAGKAQGAPPAVIGDGQVVFALKERDDLAHLSAGLRESHLRVTGEPLSVRSWLD